MVNPSTGFWNARSVALTGHTGFKGSWLALWLHALGARVHGYALNPPTTPSLFDVAGVAATLASDTRADLADLATLGRSLEAAQPEILFHLAAQPLVRPSYADPVGTIATNVLGTAHVLEVAHRLPSLRAIVIITTDKVYHNNEWEYPYREVDPLGGHDPYSASKAAAEIITASYRQSFFRGPNGHAGHVASARAGNVIGGGDWALDRLVPDCMRAFANGEPVTLRYPGAVRPWQHVLEPLSGYVLLAERLCAADGAAQARAWNFGPDERDNATVGSVAETAARLYGGSARVELLQQHQEPHEAGMLRLDSSRAASVLGWRPRWSLATALASTVEWYRAWHHGADMAALTRDQIAAYESAATP